MFQFFGRQVARFKYTFRRFGKAYKETYFMPSDCIVSYSKNVRNGIFYLGLFLLALSIRGRAIIQFKRTFKFEIFLQTKIFSIATLICLSMSAILTLLRILIKRKSLVKHEEIKRLLFIPWVFTFVALVSIFLYYLMAESFSINAFFIWSACLFLNLIFIPVNPIIFSIMMIAQMWMIIINLDFSTKASIAFSLDFLIFLLVSSILSFRNWRNIISNYKEIHDKNSKIAKIQSNTISAFSDLIVSRDSNNHHNTSRTSIFVMLICEQLVKDGFYKDELTANKINLYTSAAPLHDIGMIHLPDSILYNEGALSEVENDIMKKHTEYGYELITKSLCKIEDNDCYKIAADMALNHHERWDGSGYPANKKGTEIPLCARILSLAEYTDELFYNIDLSKNEDLNFVFDKIKEKSGLYFEPQLVSSTLKIQNEILEMALLTQGNEKEWRLS